VAANGTIGGYNGKREGVEIERKRQLLAEEITNNLSIESIPS
jgi:O6-methylguanine-DNA--protein-cysteine methyltransferase